MRRFQAKIVDHRHTVRMRPNAFVRLPRRVRGTVRLVARDSLTAAFWADLSATPQKRCEDRTCLQGGIAPGPSPAAGADCARPYQQTLGQLLEHDVPPLDFFSDKGSFPDRVDLKSDESSLRHVIDHVSSQHPVDPGSQV